MNGILSGDQAAVYLMRAAVILISLPVHEASHALVSCSLGDDTAKNRGRLSLNPMAHFDPYGAVCLLVAGVGWAKPVPIDPRRFKNPKAGMALSAAAGPAANIVLALISMILYKLLPAGDGAAVSLAGSFLLCSLWMNTNLAVFNMFPFPPWDGSRIFLTFLPRDAYFAVMKYEKIIFGIFFVVLLTGILNGPLTVCSSFVIRLLDKATCFIS